MILTFTNWLKLLIWLWDTLFKRGHWCHCKLQPRKACSKSKRAYVLYYILHHRSFLWQKCDEIVKVNKKLRMVSLKAKSITKAKCIYIFCMSLKDTLSGPYRKAKWKINCRIISHYIKLKLKRSSTLKMKIFDNFVYLLNPINVLKQSVIVQ